MFLKVQRILKRIAEKITGTTIFKKAPFGCLLDKDISNRFPNYRFTTIFDVGANIGQSALYYKSKYPSATVYCFEPIKESYEQLLKNLASKNKMLFFNIAFGDLSGKASMISKGTWSGNSLLNEERESFVDPQNIEKVNISTVDEFCKANEIKHICYLKIDTEGGDLNVLKGAENCLSKKYIDFVEVEAGMNPHNKVHVPFEDLKKFLEIHGYFIFGIYEQVNEFIIGKPNLRRTNTVFISEKLIHEYQII